MKLKLSGAKVDDTYNMNANFAQSDIKYGVIKYISI